MNQSPRAEDRPEPRIGAAAAPAAAELPPNYLELYKLAVEMADRVSARRGLANSFFLTVNTAVLALLGSAHVRWYPAAAGIVMCITWWALLKSYRDLNRAKFEVILAMEENLPARIYSEEWAKLSTGRAAFDVRPTILKARLGRYRELGYVERIVPWVFAILYLADIIIEGIR